MKSSGHKLLHWTPRILGILFALFIGMFALDVWEMDAPFWQLLGGFLIHLAPTFVILFVLAIAWFRETQGGYVFIALYAVFMLWFARPPLMQEPVIYLFLPLLLIGTLFILDGRKHASGRI